EGQDVGGRLEIEVLVQREVELTILRERNPDRPIRQLGDCGQEQRVILEGHADREIVPPRRIEQGVPERRGVLRRPEVEDRIGEYEDLRRDFLHQLFVKDYAVAGDRKRTLEVMQLVSGNRRPRGEQECPLVLSEAARERIELRLAVTNQCRPVWRQVQADL